MDSAADRFNVALREKPFTTAVKCYATASALVAVGAQGCFMKNALTFFDLYVFIIPTKAVTAISFPENPLT